MIVENRLPPGTGPSDESNREDGGASTQRRGSALDLFLHNPEEAARAYPDLTDSLRDFMAVSTNPYADAVDSRMPRAGSEQLFDEWNRAAAWSRDKR